MKITSIVLSLFAFLGLIAASASNNVSSKNAMGAAQAKALWVFGGSVVPNPVSSAAGRSRLVEMSSADGINILYVSTFRSIASSTGRFMYEDADMAALNAAAHAAGQEVWVAHGNPDWPTFTGCLSTDRPVMRMQDIVDYNGAVLPNERFDGVMLDVEPGGAFDLPTYADMHQCIRGVLPGSIKLGTAINAFWDASAVYPAGGASKPAYQHIIDLPLDSVVVMGYRDTAGTAVCASGDGLICLDQDEIAYATSAGKSGLILAGLETLDVVPGQPEKVSFFEEGKAVMDAEAALAAAHFSTQAGFGGLTIHNYQASYLGGSTGWPAPTAVGACDGGGNIDVEATGGTASGGYSTLKLAFDAINAGTHTGSINIEICGSTDEGPATASLDPGNDAGSANYTAITIAPVGGSSRTITGGTTGGNPLIDLNGADNVTINGLNTNGNSLTISNTVASSTAGTSTIRFINGATNNVISNSTILGSSATAIGAPGGTVLFGVTPTVGNSNNTISGNNISAAGANLPSKAIHSVGSVGSLNRDNSISGNNISDYFAAAGASAGIYLAIGTTDWTIQNNRLFQTAARSQSTGAIHAGIQIVDSNINNCLISGNIIGYATAAGTGTYSFTGISSSKFYPIYLSGHGTTTPTSIQGNTITAISLSGPMSGSGNTNPFSAIHVIAGPTTIGSATGNVIGSSTAAGAISLSSSGTGAAEIFGIYSSVGVNAQNISNNTVGGIAATNTSTGAVDLYGVRVTGNANVTPTIQNNTVGTAAAPIANTAPALASNVYGVYILSQAASVTGNVVSNLSMTAANTGTGLSAAIVGIVIEAPSANGTNNIAGNTIRNLMVTDPAADSTVHGVYYAGKASSDHILQRNFIYGLGIGNATTTAGSVNGIYIQSGVATYQNNMISLGGGNAAGNAISGINDGVNGSGNFYHNSIYIGGSGVVGGSPTYAMQSTISSSNREFHNNIFYNARSNGVGTGKHYAVRYGGTGVNPGGLASNGNILFASGSGGVLGFYNGADRVNLAAWQAAIGQDTNSFSSDPRFIAPEAATPDLHITTGVATAVEGGGSDVGVADDFDAQVRSGLTPVDIGADAGNFGGETTPPDTAITSSPADPSNDTTGDFTFTSTEAGTFQCSVDGAAYAVCSTPFATQVLAAGPHTFEVRALDLAGNIDPTPAAFGWTIDTAAPSISYSPLSNTTGTGNRTVTALIADNTAVAGGAVLPRIYFRKNAGAYASTQCALMGGNAQSGTYDCTIDNALVGGAVSGDVIGYFAAAQDTAGNVASSPSGIVAVSVNSITTPPVANTYSILAGFAGAMNVGSGEAITSLTNNGGLFELMNAGVMTGNVTVNITTDLTVETGTHSLNQQVEEGAGNWTLFFQASGGARLIEGSSATALINLNGADRVTFSGLAFGPGGLTIRNTGNGPTFGIVNDATFDTVLNCTVEGGNTGATGVISIGTGAVTGNDNISITDSTVRDRTDAAGVPRSLIIDAGSGGASANSNLTIASNQLFNFTRSAIETTAGENVTVTANTIYQTAARTTSLFPVRLISGTGTTIFSQNTLRDHSTTQVFEGVMINDNAGSATVSRNRIYNIDKAAATAGSFIGIFHSGSNPAAVTNVENNMVSIAPTLAAPHAISGIYDDATAGNLIANHNSVYIGGTSTSAGSWAYLRNMGSTSSVSLSGNLLFNGRTGAGAHYAIADRSSGPGSVWTSDHNLFVGTGTAGSDFFQLNSAAVDLAAWQAALPARDANSIASVAGVGPFNAGNIFVSPNDLHLKVGANNPAVDAAALVGVTVDYDGQTRPFGPAPDIGADEVQTAPTAAEVSLSGRVVDTNGRGIRNVRVEIAGGDSEPRAVLTGSFGYFTFDTLRAGETYVVTVSGTRFVFENPTRVVSLIDEMTNIDFTARR